MAASTQDDQWIVQQMQDGDNQLIPAREAAVLPPVNPPLALHLPPVLKPVPLTQQVGGSKIWGVFDCPNLPVAAGAQVIHNFCAEMDECFGALLGGSDLGGDVGDSDRENLRFDPDQLQEVLFPAFISPNGKFAKWVECGHGGCAG